MRAVLSGLALAVCLSTSAKAEPLSGWQDMSAGGIVRVMAMGNNNSAAMSWLCEDGHFGLQIVQDARSLTSDLHGRSKLTFSFGGHGRQDLSVFRLSSRGNFMMVGNTVTDMLKYLRHAQGLVTIKDGDGQTLMMNPTGMMQSIPPVLKACEVALPAPPSAPVGDWSVTKQGETTIVTGQTTAAAQTVRASCSSADDLTMMIHFEPGDAAHKYERNRAMTLEAGGETVVNMLASRMMKPFNFKIDAGWSPMVVQQIISSDKELQFRRADKVTLTLSEQGLKSAFTKLATACQINLN
ncbi:MAG: hypothetical protein Alpg2KO_00840 [Alphaproteobacteria bacterium]